jgi:Holliday junction resolvasome RuvABC endonuclease subunit
MPVNGYQDTGIRKRSSDMKTLGLDLSLTSSGFCLLDGSSITIETIKTTPKTADNDLARLAHIRIAIMERIPSDVDMICVEDFFAPFGPAAGSAIGLAMLGAVIRVALWEATMPFYVVSPSQLKKWVLGKGVGEKSLVLREVYRKLGVSATNDNEADACVLAHIAKDLLTGVKEEWAAYRKDVIEKIAKERPHYNTQRKDTGDA